MRSLRQACPPVAIELAFVSSRQPPRMMTERCLRPRHPRSCTPQRPAQAATPPPRKGFRPGTPRHLPRHATHAAHPDLNPPPHSTLGTLLCTERLLPLPNESQATQAPCHLNGAEARQICPADAKRCYGFVILPIRATRDGNIVRRWLRPATSVWHPTRRIALFSRGRELTIPFLVFKGILSRDIEDARYTPG
jgi:hypothetical protein